MTSTVIAPEVILLKDTASAASYAGLAFTIGRSGPTSSDLPLEILGHIFYSGIAVSIYSLVIHTNH